MNMAAWLVDTCSYGVPHPINFDFFRKISLKNVANWAAPISAREKFFAILCEKFPITEAYSFTENNEDKLWVVLKVPTTEIILEMMECYIIFLDENRIVQEDFYFDFLAFGINEIDKNNLPNKLVLFKNKEVRHAQ